MEGKQGNDNEQVRHPYVQEPGKLVQNPNPKANENIRVRTEEPTTQNNEPSHGVGSEITDGEDA
ncbi:MAG: hypothetical protein ACXVBX_12490 [Flavisolibacter sp.]